MLGPEDSWTAWRAAPARGGSSGGGQRRPVHSGGRALQGTWTPPREPGSPWALKLSGAMATTPFNQLWVNGERATRAREPELGSFFQYVGLLPPPNTGAGCVLWGRPEHFSESQKTKPRLDTGCGDTHCTTQYACTPFD